MATATASGTATLGQLSSVEDTTFFELQMLDRAIPNFIHLFFGMEGSIKGSTTLPENEGSVMQWNRLQSMHAVTTPLTEGIVPDPQDLTVTTVTGQVKEYGAFVKVTKTLLEIGIHKLYAEASDALGEQAGDSLDLITRAALIAETSNAQYANGRANTAAIVSGDYLNFNEIMKAITTLDTNKAYGPMPDGCFPVLLHPKACYDMFSDSNFKAVLSYAHERGEQHPWIRGHIGKAFRGDFYMTPNAYFANNGSVDVYSTLVLGKASFGVGGLAAYMPQIVREQMDKSNHTFETVRPIRLETQDFGSGGPSDPFKRIATLAWFTTFVAVVLDATFYVRIEHDTAL